MHRGTIEAPIPGLDGIEDAGGGGSAKTPLEPPPPSRTIEKRYIGDPVAHAAHMYATAYARVPDSSVIRAARLAIGFKRHIIDVEQASSGIQKSPTQLGNLVDTFNEADHNSGRTSSVSGKSKRADNGLAYKPGREPHTSLSVKEMIAADFSLAARMSELDERQLREIINWYPTLYAGGMSQEVSFRARVNVMIANANSNPNRRLRYGQLTKFPVIESYEQLSLTEEAPKYVWGPQDEGRLDRYKGFDGRPRATELPSSDNVFTNKLPEQSASGASGKNPQRTETASTLQVVFTPKSVEELVSA